MSRRNEMTDDGEVQCGLCKGWFFIGEFYTQKVDVDTSFKAIWWGDPITGKQYGRPNSYCKRCNLISQRGKAAVQQMKDLVAGIQKDYVYNVNEAWLQALEEAHVRKGPQDPYESIMRAAGML